MAEGYCSILCYKPFFMRNYLLNTVLLTFIVVVVLLGLTLVRPLGGMGLRRVNILSSLVSDSTWDSFLGYASTDHDLLAEEELSVVTLSDTVGVTDTTVRQAIIEKVVIDSIHRAIYEQALAQAPMGVTPLEDYSALGQDRVSEFMAKLNGCVDGRSQVRVAVMGDSFVECDILTSDLRRLMQERFGGSGVGYAQVESSQAPFSRKVLHNWSGWRRISAVSAPSGAKFLPSLLAYEPVEGVSNSVQWQISPSVGSFMLYDKAKLLFVNRSGMTINATINGIKRKYRLEPTGEQLQTLVIESPDSLSTDINSLKLEFIAPTGLTLYGAMLERNTGVAVDNYSVRGNSGLLLSCINGALTRQMMSMYPVDLIVLSYGLNVVEESQVNYSKYIAGMEQCVAHLRTTMPGVPILMMSVSDRLTRNSSGNLETMRGVVALEKAQRQMAQRLDLAFWSTYRAMKQMGGMELFVNKGLGAKDYTHIGPGGGRKIAIQLFDAMIESQNTIKEEPAIRTVGQTSQISLNSTK